MRAGVQIFNLTPMAYSVSGVYTLEFLDVLVLANKAVLNLCKLCLAFYEFAIY